MHHYFTVLEVHHYLGFFSKNLQLLDILACNSASKPSFQQSACLILKRWYNKQSYRPKYPEVLYLPHV